MACGTTSDRQSLKYEDLWTVKKAYIQRGKNYLAIKTFVFYNRWREFKSYVMLHIVILYRTKLKLSQVRN